MEASAVKELHKHPGSNVPAMLIDLGALIAALLTLGTGWPTDHPIWTVCVILCVAYFHHTWMTIFHEDAHYSLYPTQRWHNTFNGIIVGTFLMVPFSIYRQVHIRHHNRMNSPEDWELWPYVDPARSLTFRRIFLLFDILFGQWVGVYIYNRIFWVKHTPLRDPKVRRQIWVEYAIMAAFWGGLLAVVWYCAAWILFLKVYVIPAWVAGTFQTFRKLTEHLGLPMSDAMHGARTVVTDDPIGDAVSYTSFHISSHGVHHQFPQMPHQNLKKAMSLMERTDDMPIFRSHVQAMRDMARHLWHPGIGVNARTQGVAAENN